MSVKYMKASVRATYEAPARTLPHLSKVRPSEMQRGPQRWTL